ncbi:ferrous iron transport protein B [Anaerocolumna sp. MB42-C2]|uniref:ferrous iron transport protein B n=1 Tax=Anaerocolumna sp. MB42-C2 TaxID=3070997 RepID=UPI0027E1C28F|nr:ferrous iron transport protein B [Anaerocolumna sp. MB42-C2]WMJ87991.1 ferrous iron transport protein B [Anaerocolumna sp. MB42-C2]
MGLTSHSTGAGVLEKGLKTANTSEEKVIALGGNPNVGKSTVFNGLTGLNQHTGNWPGKTVTNAQGKYRHKDTDFILVDIPGTYSLMANSEEEEIARDFICFGNPDTTVIVADATCLERNLNLVLQTLEITSEVVVCVNLLDEARRKKININLNKLSELLGVPVIGTNARSKKGLNILMDSVYDITNKIRINTPIKITYDDIIEEAIALLEPSVKELIKDTLNSRWVSLKLLDGDESLLEPLQKYLKVNLMSCENISLNVKEAKNKLMKAGINEDDLRDKIVSQIVSIAENIGKEVVTYTDETYNQTDRKIDHILTSRIFGIPIMIGLLGIVFWLTITGANYPSSMIADFLFWTEDRLTSFCHWAGIPSWVHGLLVLGVFRTLAWVVSVMLPPMAIFFPLFTLLEDLGYLPRVAFNLDNFFKKACAHGKQALTMCMGFGCNAAGIIGCRIIDSPREKLIAMITNNFVPCNGRFPTLIAIITMFFIGVAGPFQSILAALMLTGVIVLGVVMTLLISKLLSKTLLKGLPSSFALELPPYRKPQVARVIVRSIFDRTLFVLARAVLVAAPAGVIIWVLANIQIGDLSLLSHCAAFLNPFAKLLGLDGYILMAFILGFPANEIVVPIIIMSYMATGSMVELDNLSELRTLLVSNGWTWLTAICTMLFSLMHWPCGTTCLTIRKESGSLKWTAVSFLIPTLSGVVICFIVASTVRLLGLG